MLPAILGHMVRVTISIPDPVYTWLAERATAENWTVQELIEAEVARLQQDDPEDPEFLAAVREMIESNRDLLQRLAD